MKCNKDDAIKCKGLAEKKIKNQDIVGANKFALKAQSLFPNLEGLSLLLEVINLYVASQKKINGEVDLYGIFGLDPSVDDDPLHKKYRKIALVFHPDKNKSAGAAGTFLILSEAWNVLSDKDKRSAYNLKLNLRALIPPFLTNKNGFCNFTSSSSSKNAGNMATDTKPGMPTQSRTSATAPNSHYNPPLWPKNSKGATAAQHVAHPKKTKKAATSSRHAATPLRPRNPRTAITAQNIPSRQKTFKTATGSLFVHAPSQSRNRTTTQHTPPAILMRSPVLHQDLKHFGLHVLAAGCSMSTQRFISTKIFCACPVERPFLQYRSLHPQLEVFTIHLVVVRSTIRSQACLLHLGILEV